MSILAMTEFVKDIHARNFGSTTEIIDEIIEGLKFSHIVDTRINLFIKDEIVAVIFTDCDTLTYIDEYEEISVKKPYNTYEFLIRVIV
jgi:hypothetical protein